MINKKESIKEFIEPDFDWFDSTAYVKDPEGNLIPAGTVLKITTHILFLKALTDQELLKLKETVSDSVDHEVSKRLNMENTK